MKADDSTRVAEWRIPEPLQIDWTMRQVSSANLTSRELGDGRKQFVLEHAPLPGVRPEMMVWFLKNMNSTDLEWGGRKGVLAYRFWQPRDHVHFEILGKPGPGCWVQDSRGVPSQSQVLESSLLQHRASRVGPQRSLVGGFRQGESRGKASKQLSSFPALLVRAWKGECIGRLSPRR